jgi:hypothetical protein
MKVSDRNLSQVYYAVLKYQRLSSRLQGCVSPTRIGMSALLCIGSVGALYKFAPKTPWKAAVLGAGIGLSFQYLAQSYLAWRLEQNQQLQRNALVEIIAGFNINSFHLLVDDLHEAKRPEAAFFEKFLVSVETIAASCGEGH